MFQFTLNIIGDMSEIIGGFYWRLPIAAGHSIFQTKKRKGTVSFVLDIEFWILRWKPWAFVAYFLQLSFPFILSFILAKAYYNISIFEILV